jgi:hypothetical protein
MADVDLYVQMPHHTVVTLHDPDHASACTTIQGVSGVGDLLVMNLGIYYDEMVRTDAGWRFRARWLQNVYVEQQTLTGHVPISRHELVRPIQ